MLLTHHLDALNLSLAPTGEHLGIFPSLRRLMRAKSSACMCVQAALTEILVGP